MAIIVIVIAIILSVIANRLTIYINHWGESSFRGEASLGSARNFTGVFKSTGLKQKLLPYSRLVGLGSGQAK